MVKRAASGPADIGRGPARLDVEALDRTQRDVAEVLATRWHRTLCRPGPTLEKGAVGALLSGTVYGNKCGQRQPQRTELYPL